MSDSAIQKAWFIYWDDSDVPWTVWLRQRNAVVGNFEPLNLFQYNRHPIGYAVWPYQRQAMRHITVKTEAGKILVFPCQRRDSANYNNVGGLITFQEYDGGIVSGGPTGAIINGMIMSRRAECVRYGGKIIPLDFGVG